MEAAERGVPARSSDFYFRALVEGHLRMKNNKERWKYCQCLEFYLFLFVKWRPKRTDGVISLVAPLVGERFD